MQYYKFNGHNRGVGLDEYLSQGTFNYAGNIETSKDTGFFSPYSSFLACGKIPDIAFKITKVKGDFFGFTNSGGVYYIPPGQTPTTGYNPVNDAPSLTSVFTAGGNFVRDVVFFRGEYYIFQQGSVRKLDPAYISTNTPWQYLDGGAYSFGVTYPDNVINYLNARLYFSTGDTTFKLSKIDEYGILTNSVIGRDFTSRIVGLTITGSVLNIYTEDGEKSMMDIASETIIETINIGRDVKKVVSVNNRDYLTNSYGNNERTFLSVSSGYDVVDLIRSSITPFLSKYNVLGLGNFIKNKNYSSSNSVSGYKTLAQYEDGVLFIDNYQNLPTVSYLRSDGRIHSVCSFDVLGNFLGEIDSIYTNGSDLFVSYQKNGQNYIGTTNLNHKNDLSIPSIKSYLAENVFTGGDITRKKELVSFRLRAEIPQGTRWKLKAICDGDVRDVCEIIGSDEHKTVHTYKASNVNGYEIMFIYELYGDDTFTSYNYIKQWEMEIAYNLIEE